MRREAPRPSLEEDPIGSDGPARASSPVALRAAGTCVVLDVAGPDLPRVLHWGADLPGPDGAGPDEAELLALARAAVPPQPPSAFDEPWPLTAVPGERDGWSGWPGLTGSRAGGDAHPAWRVVDVAVEDRAVRATARDQDAALELTWSLRLDGAGVAAVDLAVASTAAEGSAPYDVGGLTALLPLPARAAEVLDLTGRWSRERSPQRSPLLHGTRLRAGRRGRTGHDAPLVLVAGTQGFGFRSGEVWGVHVAWSGDTAHLVDRLPEGAGAAAAVVGGGELLAPGEVRLGPGERYDAPTALFATSTEGLDGLAQRLHRHVRARPHHPATPRPVVLNTWEAVYFDHDLGRLTRLADVAASVGVERYVLDDGWFLGRRGDTRGLGDWVVDPAVWPHGLQPLVDHVRGLGMQVGLWFEPEMVNLDSELARAHPDWVLRAREWRTQHALDMSREDVRAHLLERISALVGDLGLDFVKWDHNRDLHAVRGGVRAQVLGTYALLDALRARFPLLEVESCASGGGRVDLGVLARTDRVWASDTNDALERQSIQRWTQQLLPPELVGSHVGPPVSHTTGRVASLATRCATALFAHAGFEWDIATCTPEELDVLRAFTAMVRELRGLLHSGDVVRGDEPDPAVLVHGVVAQDGAEALFARVQLATSPDARPGRLVLPGLRPQLRYRVVPRLDLGAPADAGPARPAWWEDGGVVLSGAALAGAGLQVPVVHPGEVVLLHCTAV